MAKKLSTTIVIGGTVTGGLRSALGSTKVMLTDIGKAITQVGRQQKYLGDSVSVYRKMGIGVEGLRQKYTETTAAIDRMRAAQAKLNGAQQTSDRINARAGKVAAVGAGMSVAGGVMLATVVPGVKEAKHYETETGRIGALGMGAKTTAQAVAFAQEMKTFGTSQLENLELLRDGMSVFADLHHAEMVAPLLAKMKFANKAMFGTERGEQQSAQFIDMLKVIETRGGLKSKEEFTKQANMIQQVISATGGRVSATEWRHFLMRGGLAGKSMSSESLFYTMEHMVQEMGGDTAGTGLNSLYKSVYQGKGTMRSKRAMDRFGLITDRSKVHEDKAGQLAYFDPGAVMGSDVLRDNPFDWMENVLLPQLAKKGITQDKQIEDTIGMVVSNSVGAAFLAEMYRQRENIKRARARNKEAQNVDQLDAAGKQTSSGKELEAQAKLANLKLRLGNEILPLYARGLELVTNGLERLNRFTAENPRLAKTVVIGVAAIGAALVVVGPLLITTAGAMGIYAGAQLMMARVAAATALSTAAAGGGLGIFGSAMARVAGIVPGLLSVVRPLALAFLIASPPMWVVVAAAAAIVAAGFLIWKYWEPIKGFFSGFGEGLVAGMAPVAKAFSDAFAPIWEVVGPVVMPVLQSIGKWFGELFTPIDKASSTTVAFSNAGKVCGEVVAGAFNIMLNPIMAVVDSVRWLLNNIGGLGSKVSAFGSTARAMFGGGAPAVPAMAVKPAMAYPGIPALSGGRASADTMAYPGIPALPAGRMGGDTITQTNTFTINQLPGQSSKDLAAEIQRHIDQGNAVKRRSMMYDTGN